MGRVLLVLTPLPLILLGFSLGYYLYQVRNYPLSDLNSVKPMDCAVVLTGAKARIPWALQALKQSRFQKLLISGVHPQTRKEQLLSFTTDTPETLHEAIFIDQQSRSTTDNAYYSLSWATQQSCESLGIISSSTHIPRALLIFQNAKRNHAALHALQLVPIAVPSSPWESSWLGSLEEASKLTFYILLNGLK